MHTIRRKDDIEGRHSRAGCAATLEPFMPMKHIGVMLSGVDLPPTAV